MKLKYVAGSSADVIDMQQLVFDIAQSVRSAVAARPASPLEIHTLPTVYSDPVVVRQIIEQVLTLAVTTSRVADQEPLRIGTTYSHHEVIWFVTWPLFRELKETDVRHQLSSAAALLRGLGGRLWMQVREDDIASVCFVIA